MSQVKQIYKKYDKTPLDSDVIELREILGNRMGYFPKMAEWLFTNKSNLDEIRIMVDLLDIIKINKSISKFNDPEELRDHIHVIQNKRKLNQVIKSIPSNARKNISTRIKDFIYLNIDMDHIFKDFLSKKGGTCKTEDILYQRLVEIVNLQKGGTSYKVILKRISRKINKLNFKSKLFQCLLNCYDIFWWYKLLTNKTVLNKKHGEIVYKDGKTIIVRVESYKLSSAIGSRHWCISYSNYHWEDYASEKGDNIQYFIYQTEFDDRRSMIGVTIEPGDIERASHYRDDSSCYGSDHLEKYSKYLKGKKIDIKSIDDVIRYKITDLNIIFSFPNWYIIFISSSYYLENILLDISLNHLKYKHENVCEFIYNYVGVFGNINHDNMVKIIKLVNYNDPFFCDDQSAKNKLTKYKLVECIKNNTDSIRFYENTITSHIIDTNPESYIVYNGRRFSKKYLDPIVCDIELIMLENIKFNRIKWNEMNIMDRYTQVIRLIESVRGIYFGRFW